MASQQNTAPVNSAKCWWATAQNIFPAHCTEAHAHRISALGESSQHYREHGGLSILVYPWAAKMITPSVFPCNH
uniref:Uncharacterized protein n=1 Tax=Anguilla anguilla TaxID=7936 RepID=A0A0E9QH34_ANGAN